MQFIVVWCYHGLLDSYRESYRLFMMYAETKDPTELRRLAGKRLLLNRCVNHWFVMLNHLYRFNWFGRLGIARRKLSTHSSVARRGWSWLW